MSKVISSLFSVILAVSLSLSGANLAFADTTTSDPQSSSSTTLTTVNQQESKQFLLDVHIDFHGNWFFSRYDVNLLLDGEQQTILKHGEDADLQFQVPSGDHTLIFEKTDDPDIQGSFMIPIQANTKSTIGINCSSSKVSIEGSYEAEITEPETNKVSESTFSQEMAQRAIVTAMTNYTAKDVFEKDGKTYCVDKFHAYSDTQNAYISVETDGTWTSLDEASWHVDNLFLHREGDDIYHLVFCDITQDDDQLVLLNLLDISSPKKTEIEKYAGQIQEALISGEEVKAGNYSDAINVEYRDSSNDAFSFAIPASLISKDREKSPSPESTSSNKTPRSQDSNSNPSGKADSGKSTTSAAKRDPLSTQDTAATSASTETSSEKETFTPGWNKVGSAWYYRDNNGDLCKNQWVDSKYYVGDDGKMVTNKWVGDYYVSNDGTYATDSWIGDYYVGSDGKTITNAWVGDYYVDDTGKYVTNAWVGDYYVGNSGAYLKNAWVDNYYVGADGKYVTNTWVDNYYVGSDGVWIPNYGNTVSASTTSNSSTAVTRSYVINTNTGKFHIPSCSSAKRIAAHNRWDYEGTRDEIINMGYQPCKRCYP